MNITQMYYEDVKNANGDVAKLEVIYRSKWLYLNRGKVVSTVNNKFFQEWFDFCIHRFCIHFVKKP